MSAGTQPITLVTATPGGGKTALVVDLMRKAADAGRPIFQLGIPELKLPYIPTPPVKDWTEKRIDPEDPDQNELDYFTFPENSLIVLDEAQRIFRVRATGSKIPDHVAAFETVRHTGVTFILMTQNPTFLDSHIRKLVGQHIHLRDVGLLGRWYYEWPECANPENFNTAPIKRKFKLPKHVFSLYKSSSLHIKRRYTVPPALMMLIACVLLVAFLGWRVYHSMYQRTHSTPTTPVAAAGPTTAAGASSPSVAPAALPAPTVRTNDGGEYLAAFVPIVPGKPESAPAYADLRQVKAMPIVVGGACMGAHCICYNQQGRDAGLDEMQCRDWLKKPPFDPYRDPVAGPVDPGAMPGDRLSVTPDRNDKGV
ncbi:zona occludens toxin [Ralstonia sp. 25mfcol4.1]|uniref:zonular occludens toxin domain-containing protein n=1 Tax=Ralstonia sp. 25mfcol4.1 TaxID=1761899 RepID=UPI00087F50A1|nr:zonular occludens toxin domain-containing protein [Ralstonia sp. 25mfcol4.1]SDP38578.1 zona occludens toxin [Ralstonia sp. 25mfcol4.1]